MTMRTYDQIVVGGGIGGMTLAALLGQAGRKVLLLEREPRLGGSMARFTRRGIPFDTGFHFTGGFVHGGILADMLDVLGLADRIRPIPVREARDNRFIFENTGHDYALPTNYRDLVAAFKRYFPGEHAALDRYFALVDRVCDHTASMDLRQDTPQLRRLPEEDFSLAAVVEDLTANAELRALLCAYAACYGTPSSQVSFANHSRICHGLYRSIARVEGGGQAFTDAFQHILPRMDVDIRCATALSACTDIQSRRVGRFVLSSGEEVAAGECIYTIHPWEILATLPRDHLHKAFVDRIEALEPSIGFFCLYGVVRAGAGDPAFAPAIVSLLPAAEARDLFRRGPRGHRMAVILKHRETVGRKGYNVLTALEASMPEDVAPWADSGTGRRPAAYQAYKQACRERLEQRVLATFPEYAANFEVIETASMLTFRDYLHSRWGCAYGARQQIGQFNLFGRLPFRNLYAAGQSAMLPGIVGSMLASFLLVKKMIGREAYAALVGQGRPFRRDGSME